MKLNLQEHSLWEMILMSLLIKFINTFLKEFLQCKYLNAMDITLNDYECLAEINQETYISPTFS